MNEHGKQLGGGLANEMRALGYTVRPPSDPEDGSCWEMVPPGDGNQIWLAKDEVEGWEKASDHWHDKTLTAALNTRTEAQSRATVSEGLVEALHDLCAAAYTRGYREGCDDSEKPVDTEAHGDGVSQYLIDESGAREVILTALRDQPSSEADDDLTRLRTSAKEADRGEGVGLRGLSREQRVRVMQAPSEVERYREALKVISQSVFLAEPRGTPDSPWRVALNERIERARAALNPSEGNDHAG